MNFSLLKERSIKVFRKPKTVLKVDVSVILLVENRIIIVFDWLEVIIIRCGMFGV